MPWAATSSGRPGSTIDTYRYLGSTESVIAITTGATTTTSAIDGQGDRLAVTAGSAFGWSLPDLHGNLAAYANSGLTAASDAFRYDPYGELITQTTPSATPSPWRFQGRLQENTGSGTAELYDFGFRSYSPGLAAFMSLDDLTGSAQNPLTLNRFLYAAANPTTLVDPDGHCTRWIDDTCADKRIGGDSHRAAHLANVDRSTRITNTKRRGDKPWRAIPPTYRTGAAVIAYYRVLTAINKRVSPGQGQYLDQQDDDQYARGEGERMGPSLGGELVGGFVDELPNAVAFGAGCVVTEGGLCVVAGAWALGGLAGAVLDEQPISLPSDPRSIGGLAADLLGGLGGYRMAGGRMAELGPTPSRVLGEEGPKLIPSICGVHSFSATTAVATAAGPVAIADVHVGDQVTARDPSTGEVAEHTVTNVDVHTDAEIEYLHVDGETIETTPTHRFLTDHGWVEAAALDPGTKIVELDGSSGTVEDYSIEVRSVIMYDLTVSDVHTFAVGEGQWVVHNAGPCDVTNPSSFLGATEQQARDAIPTSWGPGEPTRTGGGTRWFKPGTRRSDGIRIMPGDPAATGDLIHQGALRRNRDWRRPP